MASVPPEEAAREARAARERRDREDAGRADGAVAASAERRFREVFRRAHAHHPGCAADEWLSESCIGPNGTPAERPLVWSRRNGAWRQVDVLWVGAAPGNAGGRGSGDMGAHATRIPFGGDVAGANLDVLLASIGLTRNDTFIVAALNSLPDAGGGEPKSAELARPIGEFDSSLELLRATVLAAAPRLIVALGNLALRSTIAAARLRQRPAGRRGTLPGLARIRRAGTERGQAHPWPEPFAPDDDFMLQWAEVAPDGATAERTVPPAMLWLTHPSAQNMSAYAGVETAFHTRMVETRDALVRAAREVLGSEPPARRPPIPAGAEAERLGGVYALPDWLEAVGPRHRELGELWREKGV